MGGATSLAIQAAKGACVSSLVCSIVKTCKSPFYCLVAADIFTSGRVLDRLSLCDKIF